MKKVLIAATLAVGLTACENTGTPEQAQARREAIVNFISQEIALAEQHYGENWLGEIGQHERFGILSACNAMMLLPAFGTEIPMEIPAATAEVCRALRGAMDEGYIPLWPES